MTAKVILFVLQAPVKFRERILELTAPLLQAIQMLRRQILKRRKGRRGNLAVLRGFSGFGKTDSLG
jgi:hypothetical protein